MAAAGLQSGRRDNGIQDHMARLKLRLLNEKLSRERQRRRPSSASSSEDETHIDPNIRLQQAKFKRDDLLGRLRKTQGYGNGSVYDFRPLSNRSHQRSRRSYYSPPPSRRSLPADMSSQRHVIEHKIHAPSTQAFPPIMSGPPQPMPVSMPGYPVYPYHEQKSSWNKGDFMEMMMMQNAQMHQLVMNQMMLGSMGGGSFGHSHQPTPIVVQEPIVNNNSNNRPPSVHHHHYQMPNQQISHLPPIDHRKKKKPRPPPPRVPQEVPPLQEPRAPKTVIRQRYPFPGPNGMRKMRHTFYAAFFVAALKDAITRDKSEQEEIEAKMNAVSDVFIFGIQLKEAIAALHRIYLNQEGRIYPLLMEFAGDGVSDYPSLIENPGQSGEKELYIKLTDNLKNLVFCITEIMPSSGVLGPHKKAVVYQLVQNGKKFPKGYFWLVEKERLQFDADNRTKNVSDVDAKLLLVGVFFSRALVTTLLMKPMDYGLTKSRLANVSQRNLMFLASLIIYIVRKTCSATQKGLMPVPNEIAKFLFRDEDLKPALNKLRVAVDQSVKYINEWALEYVRRLKNATD